VLEHPRGGAAGAVAAGLLALLATRAPPASELSPRAYPATAA
jgi:glycerate kinase